MDRSTEMLFRRMDMQKRTAAVPELQKKPEKAASETQAKPMPVNTATQKKRGGTYAQLMKNHDRVNGRHIGK